MFYIAHLKLTYKVSHFTPPNSGNGIRKQPGIELTKLKCQYLNANITYLSQDVSGKGGRKCTNKLKSLLNALRPTKQ